MGTTIFDRIREEQKPQQSNIFDTLRDEQERSTSVNSMQPERTVGGTLGDVAVTAGKGIVGAGEAAVGLANLATPGIDIAGLAEKYAGYDPKTVQKLLTEQYSPAQQAANKKVEEAKGFFGTAGAMLENPSTIAHSVLESAPLMIGGGAIARGLIKATPKLATKGGALVASALGEGSVGAGSAAEQIRQEKGKLDTKGAAAAIASGAGTGIFNFIGGSLARKFGFADIDTMLAGSGVKGRGKDIAGRIVKGGISEGVFEELPQSMQEQIWQNAALDKPLMQGVPEAGATGMLVGAAMGGGANAASVGGEKKEAGEGLTKNQAALELREQNLPSDDLRLLRDNPEFLAEQAVDKASVVSLLTERAADNAMASEIIENEPNPGPLTRAGKTGIRQEWAKHVLDQPGQDKVDDKKSDTEANGDTDINAARQLAEVLSETEIESDADRTERATFAQQFMDEPKISDDAKQHFWDTGVPESLGLKLPGKEQAGPMQDEWERQEEISQKYNQIKNKKPKELSREEQAFMEEYEKGNESASAYPGGPLAAAEQLSDQEVADHEKKVKQEKEKWKADNKRAAFQKRLVELQEETDNQDDVDTGVLAMADPKIKKQAEKDAEKIVRENPVYQQKEEIKKGGGLDIHQAKETWDESTISGLVKRYPGLFTAQVMNGPKPMEIDTTASELGYESADAMIQAFVDAPTIKGETSRLVQQYEQEWAAADAAQAADESIQQPPVHAPVTEQSQEDFQILLDRVKANPKQYSKKDFDEQSISDEQRKILARELQTPDVSTQGAGQVSTTAPAETDRAEYSIIPGTKRGVSRGDIVKAFPGAKVSSTKSRPE